MALNQKKCKHCKELYKGKVGQRFCNKSCAVSYSNKKRKIEVPIILKCQLCGKILDKKKQFCSREHYYLFYRSFVGESYKDLMKRLNATTSTSN